MLSRQIWELTNHCPLNTKHMLKHLKILRNFPRQCALPEIAFHPKSDYNSKVGDQNGN
jgi:hypothetical protein